MIRPHGTNQLNPRYIMDDQEWKKALILSKDLVRVEITSAAAANAVMLGAGYFSPLDGFMNKKDALCVADKMQTSAGLFFPVPILNLLANKPEVKTGEKLLLCDPNVEGHPALAIQSVESIEVLDQSEMNYIVEKIFRTTDPKHPGVAAFFAQGPVLVSGPIQVLNFSYFQTDFPDTFRTAYQIRDQIEKLGWQKVVAFQTRNPMHRAHEELCRTALMDLHADGILIHMLLGKLKPGDIPADVRDESIRTLVEHHFPINTVLIAGYGFDMLYAGPREAVLHALFRQNCGCTHLIVGRDHAGVGDYYGPFDAQTIFEKEVPNNALEIEIYKADHTAWSKKLNRVVMMSKVTDHTPDDFVMLSGTKVREMLTKGEPLPEEFTRPEVAQVLGRYYKSLAE